MATMRLSGPFVLLSSNPYVECIIEFDTQSIVGDGGCFTFAEMILNGYGKDYWTTNRRRSKKARMEYYCLCRKNLLYSN